MKHVAIIGAGITGVTSAYALQERGFEVTVFDRHRYPAMETSFANGGQLSACNAEVWNNLSTARKSLKWLFRKDAPLLLNPTPSWHKYTWLAEFLASIRSYRENTLDTLRLALDSRIHLFEIAKKENIEFDLVKRGILHVFHTQSSYEANLQTNKLLNEGGLERYPVTPDEISEIEPALGGQYVGGLYTPSDASGDIHKYTRGLADACIRKGARFNQDAVVENIRPDGKEFVIKWRDKQLRTHEAAVDIVLVCAGVSSRAIASQLGDRLNVYPVKGYSITVNIDDRENESAAPQVSLLDEEAKIVTSRLGADRFRVAGTAEFAGFNYDIRAERILPLVEWVHQNFPHLDTSRVVPWAGLRPMMPNMMPVVRAGNRRGVFYNTGHGHLGWTLSAATAQLVAQLIEQNSLELER